MIIGIKAINRCKIKQYIIDKYEKKQQINVREITNKQLLMQIACKYNDVKTVDAIIESSNSMLYLTKSFNASINKLNIDTTIILIELGALNSHNPNKWLTYKRQPDFILSMINRGLELRYLYHIADYDVFYQQYINKYILDNYISIIGVKCIIMGYIFP